MKMSAIELYVEVLIIVVIIILLFQGRKVYLLMLNNFKDPEKMKNKFFYPPSMTLYFNELNEKGRHYYKIQLLLGGLIILFYFLFMYLIIN